MKTYRLKLRSKSPWATPWHADTLFGCLCWKWRALAGEDGLKKWLDRFRANDPVFLLSDAFPGDWLPLPLGRLAPSQGQTVKVKPPIWVPSTEFEALARDPNRNHVVDPNAKPPFTRCDRLQSSIGRISGTTADDGALFEVPQEHLTSDGFFTVYFRTEEDPSALLECFRLVSLSGFGKKSSTGLGAFNLDGGPEPCPWLDQMAQATGFIALSHFVPSKTDPVEGSWRLLVKYPKYQGNAVEHPFKGRLLTLTPGSVFYTGAEPMPFYGRMIPLKEFHNQALHYALCFPAPAILPKPADSHE